MWYAVGIIAIFLLAFWLFSGIRGAPPVTPPDVPAPGTFDGCSLAVGNAPANAAYWAADFPYVTYTGKISLRSINEGGYLPAPLPSTTTMRIVLMTSDYQCVDEYCQRLFSNIHFEDGQHYLIDLATGVVAENPDPPAPTPEPTGLPEVKSISIPTVQSGEAFTIPATIFLPNLRGDNQGWSIGLHLYNAVGDEPITLVKTPSASFLSTYLRAKSEASPYFPDVGKLFLPLDKADGIYSIIMETIARRKISRYAPEEDLPPGDYIYKAVFTSTNNFWVEGPTGGLATSGSEKFEVGQVGVLKVT